MLQTKQIVNNRYPHSTFGEKIISFLNRPLFTIPLSKQRWVINKKIKKPLLSKRSKVVKRNRSITSNKLSKPEPAFKKNVASVFTSGQNIEDFERIQFVLKACNKNGGKDFTNVLHVEQIKNGSRLIATDGHRMHVSVIDAGITPGNYKPVITGNIIRFGIPVQNINYPIWQRVVPENVVRCGCINIDNNLIRQNSRVYISFSNMSGEKVNPNYLADLTKKTWVIYRQNEKQKALLLKEYGAKNETYAVIMPFK